MKITFLLIFATTALFVIHTTSASPIQVIQAYNDEAKTDKEPAAIAPPAPVLGNKDGLVETVVGRQQTVSVPAQAPAAVDDDDDDDDEDDDDIESALDDDDDEDGMYFV